MRHVLALGAIALALTISGCSRHTDLKNIPGYGQKSGKRIDGRALRPVANPSEVAATDIAFSRAARDEGQWTAFRRFHAPGAQIHGRNGAVDAADWLAGKDDPKVPVQWTPVAVWSSCDGSTAVTQGKFADPDGSWGYYVTVWERQADGRYRWVYDMSALDDELTASETAKSERDARPRGDNVVVIQAIEAIEGRVADCKSSGDESTPPLIIPSEGMKIEQGYSRDGSLGWTAMHATGGLRIVQVTSWKKDGYEQSLRFVVGADGKHIPEQ